MSLPQAFPAFNDAKALVKSGKTGNLFVLILDESGSMANVKDDTLAGVNALIESQKNDPIKSLILINKFEGGRFSQIRNANINDILPMTKADYRPEMGGGTNLYDAVGRTINEVNAYLKNIDVEKRPSVIIQITTDGFENSSREYDSQSVKKLITEGTEADWVFTFVGADIDAYAVSHSIGINAAAVSSYSKGSTMGMYDSMSSSVSRMKGMRSAGTTSAEIYGSNAVYTTDERAQMNGDKK